MRQRRPLWVIGALVLVLHWLVLDGLPWRSSAASMHAPTATAFATRTLAPPPPAAPLPGAAAPGASQRPPTHKPKPVRKVTVPVTAAAPQSLPGLPNVALIASPEVDAQDLPGPGTAADTSDAETVAQATDNSAVPPDADTNDAAQTDADTTLVADAAAHSDPAPGAASSTQADEVPALSGAIDIVPPGRAAASAPASSAAPEVRIPPSMRLEFDVSGQAKKFNYSARAELLWQHDGQNYQAKQEISMLFLGSRTQTSVGTLSATGLLPERFGDRARSEQAAHFDYAQGRVTFSANTPDAPMATGTQDRLSVFLQLGALLAAAPERYPAGTRIRVATVSARAADVWSFTIEGEETLDLPAGALAAIKLERLPRRDHDQTAQIWLAPTLDYLPVRIRIGQANGDFADLRLRSHSAP